MRLTRKQGPGDDPRSRLATYLDVWEEDQQHRRERREQVLREMGIDHRQDVESLQLPYWTCSRCGYIADTNNDWNQDHTCTPHAGH